jgi:hypothetical protein
MPESHYWSLGQMRCAKHISDDADISMALDRIVTGDTLVIDLPSEQDHPSESKCNSSFEAALSIFKAIMTPKLKPGGSCQDFRPFCLHEIDAAFTAFKTGTEGCATKDIDRFGRRLRDEIRHILAPKYAEYVLRRTEEMEERFVDGLRLLGFQFVVGEHWTDKANESRRDANEAFGADCIFWEFQESASTASFNQRLEEIQNEFARELSWVLHESVLKSTKREFQERFGIIAKRASSTMWTEIADELVRHFEMARTHVMSVLESEFPSGDFDASYACEQLNQAVLDHSHECVVHLPTRMEEAFSAIFCRDDQGLTRVWTENNDRFEEAFAAGQRIFALWDRPSIPKIGARWQQTAPEIHHNFIALLHTADTWRINKTYAATTSRLRDNARCKQRPIPLWAALPLIILLPGVLLWTALYCPTMAFALVLVTGMVFMLDQFGMRRFVAVRFSDWLSELARNQNEEEEEDESDSADTSQPSSNCAAVSQPSGETYAE